MTGGTAESSFVAEIAIENKTDAALSFPKPLVMPLAGDTNKNNIRVYDTAGKALPMDGVHSDYAGRPRVEIPAHSFKTWEFHLEDYLFPAMAKPGTYLVELWFFANKSDETAWQGRVAMERIRVERKASRSVDSWIRDLGNASPSTRIRAVDALTGNNSETVVRALTAALEDQDKSVRRHVVRALQAQGVSATESLRQALDDVDVDVRRAAAHALGSTKSDPAVKALLRALKDPDPYVRAAAAESLGKIGDAGVVESVIACLEDEHSAVRDRAACALAQLKDARALEPLIRALEKYGAANIAVAIGTLGQGDRRATESLIAALKHEKPEVRQFAAHALGNLKTKEAVEPLIEALKDSQPGVRYGAARALKDIPDVRALPALAAAQRDSEWTVQREAGDALNRLGLRNWAWTDNEGNHWVEAAPVAVEAGSVRLRKKDGSDVLVREEALIQGDRRQLKKWLAGPEAEARERAEARKRAADEQARQRSKLEEIERRLMAWPDNPALLVERADAYMAMKAYREARCDYDLAIAFDPCLVDAYLRRAQVRLEGHDGLDGQVADFKKAFELRPGDLEIRKRLAWAYANRGFNAVAWAESTEFDADKAIPDFDRALRLDPNIAMAYQYRAQAWSLKKEYDKAIADYTETLRLETKDADTRMRVHHDRGLAWAAKGQLEKALNDINEAIRLAPNDAVPYLNRGGIKEQQGDLNAAIADYDEAIRRRPWHPEDRGQYEGGKYYLARALAWHTKRDYAKARADYNEAVRLAKEHSAEANRARAWFLATCPEAEYRNAKQAIDDAKQACKLSPYIIRNGVQINEWPYLEARAAAHAEAGQFDEAVKWQKLAVERVDKEHKDEVQTRLELYKAGKPYREN